jgi:hypothetical protein
VKKPPDPGTDLLQSLKTERHRQLKLLGKNPTFYRRDFRSSSRDRSLNEHPKVTNKNSISDDESSISSSNSFNSSKNLSFKEPFRDKFQRNRIFHNQNNSDSLQFESETAQIFNNEKICEKNAESEVQAKYSSDTSGSYKHKSAREIIEASYVDRKEKLTDRREQPRISEHLEIKNEFYHHLTDTSSYDKHHTSNITSKTRHDGSRRVSTGNTSFSSKSSIIGKSILKQQHVSELEMLRFLDRIPVPPDIFDGIPDTPPPLQRVG